MKTIIRDQIFEGPEIDLGEDVVYVNCTFVFGRNVRGRRVDLVSCTIQTPVCFSHLFDVSFQHCLFAPYADSVEWNPDVPWSLPYDLALP